ncbi:myoD family inhibitor-like [Arapaima gigas]
MDMQLESEDDRDVGQDAAMDHCSTQNHTTEPTLDAAKGDHTQEATSSDVRDQGSCDFSLVGDVYHSDDPHPFPHSAAESTEATENPTCDSSTPILKDSVMISKAATNGAMPICSPPSLSTGHSRWPPQQSPRNKRPVRLDKKRLPSTSTANSQHSLKTTASQIQQVAGDDCCVHCVLACLFCELLSLCSVLMQCLACGQGCETLCCCGGGPTGGVACGEDTCTAALDCGMLEDCCESSDCLEICLECCSICFPA